MNKLRVTVAALISLLTIAGTSATALAAGASYIPPAPSAPQTVTKPVTTKSSALTSIACNAPTAPSMTVTSPSENSVVENQNGIWTIELFPGQDFAEWQANWAAPAGATSYNFEVSTNSTTDSTSGQFTSPIAADSVSGSQLTSGAMQISPEEVYYFHVKASGPGCPGEYSPVEEIHTTLFQGPLSLARHDGTGTKGLELLATALVIGGAITLVNKKNLSYNQAS